MSWLPTPPEVQREMTDWFLGMDDAERVRYFKERMRERRHFNGAIDASRTQAFENALASFRSALGLPATHEMDEALFQASVLRRAPKGSLKPPSRNGSVKRIAEPTIAAAEFTPHPEPESAPQSGAAGQPKLPAFSSPPMRPLSMRHRPSD